MRAEAWAKLSLRDAAGEWSGSRNIQFPGWMKAGFWACIVIAIAVVVRRAIALLVPLRPGAPPQLGQLDAYFRTHATLTWIHILTALVFVLLLPLFFWGRTRNSMVVQRGFLVVGVLVAMTAYAMNRYAIGGWLERSAVLFFDTLFLAALLRSFFFSRRGDPVNARRWSIRAAAVLLGIATTRPVMGVFFATAPLTHFTPQQFFGVAFWIGFSINTIAIELWLRSINSTTQGSDHVRSRSASATGGR
jgi:hypothetical protein